LKSAIHEDEDFALTARRWAVEHVRTYHFNEYDKLPLVVESVRIGASLIDWLVPHKEFVLDTLTGSGAILFRGFDVAGQTGFEELVRGLFGRTMDYVYRSTPRTLVGEGVYTATEYPARHTIPFHNENAYQRDWPMYLVFYCLQPASQGGETPIADTVRVTGKIPPHILEEFESKKVMYVRNYGQGLDLPWQNVFQTESRADVERFCIENEITFEWKSDDSLRTSQVCQSVALHPRTRQRIWFNQAHLFHISSLDEATRKSLLKICGEDGVPRNAYYGDGSGIADETLALIRGAYQSESVVFSWKRNDVVFLDNMLVSHARKPYQGQRKILASMAEPYSAAMTKNLALSK
jgi:alpha-ketoglutarate-dependent taurine dioxygenase